MRYFVEVGGRTFQVDVEPGGIRVDGEAVDAELVRVPGTPVWSLLADGASHRVLGERDGSGRWTLHVGGRRVPAEVVDERTRAIREMAGSAAGDRGPTPLRAPMPGLVVKVEVDVGEEVRPGQGLVIVEAMKMENELTAQSGARVAKVHVAPGEPVEKDQVLVEFEAPDGDGGGGGNPGEGA